jgi:hypothetical protein
MCPDFMSLDLFHKYIKCNVKHADSVETLVHRIAVANKTITLDVLGHV